MGRNQFASAGEVVEGSYGQERVPGMCDLRSANQSVSADGSRSPDTGEDGRLQRSRRKQSRASSHHLQQPERQQAELYAR